ncbi:MAG: hypothetical protein E2590_05895 [Chryseobacterium sp.]|uniref:hypothetical protein n=1 Tax=Epilithonimonas caeni TaxID=365343 RepID=UPI00048217D6|nr:hypothetical protein [Epilithonimonas caeni]MPS72671.1 hypothetical protein [Chryseobacterium sp.]
MALLNSEEYNEVVLIGKKAVDALKEDKIDTFYSLVEEAWLKFPIPRNTWNQEYNFSKMSFKHSMTNRNFEQAEKWLNRMIDNNNNLNLSEFEVQHYEAIYFFETGNFNQAFEKWKYVVKGAGLRYFEGEDAKYKNFYKNGGRL